MATTQVGISELKRQFAIKNLKRLSRHELPKLLEKGHPNDEFPCKLAPGILQDWSRKDKNTLHTAIAGQAFGESSLSIGL